MTRSAALNVPSVALQEPSGDYTMVRYVNTIGSHIETAANRKLTAEYSLCSKMVAPACLQPLHAAALLKRLKPSSGWAASLRSACGMLNPSSRNTKFASQRSVASPTTTSDRRLAKGCTPPVNASRCWPGEIFEGPMLTQQRFVFRSFAH